MGLRIAVGGFMHETNTFVAKPTTWNDFVEAGPWPTLTIGEGVLSTFRGINLAIAYFMDAAEKAGHVMVPLAWGGAMPGGKVARDAFERMAGIMVDGLRREKPDAVFLELHGAMVAEHHDDGEGELLARVRDTVGPDVPILMSLDLHANVSPAMVAAADFISSYRTYPHVDWGASGGRCRRMARPRARLEAPGAGAPAGTVPRAGHHRLHLCRAREGALRGAEAHRGGDRRASLPQHGLPAGRHPRRRPERHGLWPGSAGGRRRRRSSVRGARRGRAGLCRPSPAAGR